MDIKNLEKRLEQIDRTYSMTKVEEETFSTIVMLTEKKEKLKRITRQHRLGRRYTAIVNIIEKEFPYCDLEDIKWVLFKQGYIKKSTLNIALFAFSVIGWVASTYFVYQWLDTKLFIFPLGFFLCLAWGVIATIISDWNEL